MQARLATVILVATVLATAVLQPHPSTQTQVGAQRLPATELPSVDEIMQRAFARAVSQDEAEAELTFESLVATTIESLNGDEEVTDTETLLHLRYPLAGAVYEELIERDGEALSAADIDDEAERREKFGREAQEASARGEVLETNDERQVRFDAELMSRYTASVDGEAVVRGERCWVLGFTPRDGKLPENTRIDKALNRSSGQMYVSQDDYGIMQIDFRLLRPVRYVWGLVASLSQATGRLEFGRAEPNVWLPSTFELRVDIRILFRTQRRHILREWVERRRISGDADAGF